MSEIPKIQPDGPNPNQGPEATQDQDSQSRMSAVVGKLGEVARWTAPVVGDAVAQEAGLDLGDNRPELTEGQQFGSQVARFAMRRAAQHIAERQAA